MDQNEEMITMLVDSPLLFDMFRAVVSSPGSVTASEVAWESRSALPNTMRVLKWLSKLELINVETRDGLKHYSVDTRKRKTGQELIDRALDREIPSQFRPLAAAHYASILAQCLSESVPRDWRISSGAVANHLGRGFAIEPFMIIHPRSDTPLVVAVEVCVGPLNDRVYAMAGKAACLRAEDLAMLIVLLIQDRKTGGGEEVITRLGERAEDGWCKFAFIHAKRDLKMGDVSREIIRVVNEYLAHPSFRVPQGSVA